MCDCYYYTSHLYLLEKGAKITAKVNYPYY
jgi:hypothetical protein